MNFGPTQFGNGILMNTQNLADVLKDINMSEDAKIALSAFRAGDIIKWSDKGPNRVAAGIITQIDGYEVTVDWFIMSCELTDKNLTYRYSDYSDFSIDTFWLFKCEILSEQEKLVLLLKIS